MKGEDQAGVVLDVYDGRDGLWHPEHGEIEMPDGWEHLPSGDAFVTRRVKQAGVYWVLWRPRSRSTPHRRILGLLAPATTIETARTEAAATAEARAAKQIAAARHRSRGEDRYRDDLAEAIVVFLNFTPEHAGLARTIAVDAATRAAEVGSGRVGRTRKLSLEQRAVLAARAVIRHRYTDYEDRLAGEVWDDDYFYRDIKAEARQAVDAFLDRHRHGRPDDLGR